MHVEYKINIIFNKNIIRVLQQLCYVSQFSQQLILAHMNAKDYQLFLDSCQLLYSLPANRNIMRVNATNQLFILKHIYHHSITQSTLNQTTLLESILKHQKQLNHENLLSVIDFYCQPTNKQIVILTEYCTHTLYDEYQARKTNGNKFTINQLENILISVVKAIKYLSDADVGHGCLSLKDIMLDPNGMVKLVDPSMASNSPFYVQEGYYYSPQILVHNLYTLECSSNTENIDFFKNDIFVLGLNLLQLGLPHLEISDCIDYRQGTIDIEYLQNYLNEFQKEYSVTLTILLSKMLQEDQTARISIQQCLEYIDQQLFMSDDESEDAYEATEYSNAQIPKNKTVHSFLLSNEETPYSSITSNEQSLLIENPLSFVPKNKLNNLNEKFLKC